MRVKFKAEMINSISSCWLNGSSMGLKVELDLYKSEAVNLAYEIIENLDERDFDEIVRFIESVKSS